jgi:ligand-binding SRPBCC domain-containing protein
MRTFTIERLQVVPRPVEETFAFFADAGNLEAITPPWLSFRMLTPVPIAVGLGTRISYALRWRGVPLRWQARIEAWREGCFFADRQVRGPYPLWVHEHAFEPIPGGTQVHDRVEYALPFGLLGIGAHAALIRRDLEAIFDFRGEAVARALGGAAAPMATLALAG